MLDPAMELLHRKAKIGIRDAIYDRNILTGAANDLADWDGSNFEFNPHKYNKY